MTNSSTTHPSPNNSDSSDQPSRDHVLGGNNMVPINDHDIMTMYNMDSSASSTNSSSSSMQSMHNNMHAMVLGDHDHFDPFSLLSNNRYDMTGSAGFPDNNNNNMPSACLTQVCNMVEDGLNIHSDYGILMEPNNNNNNKMGLLENDFSLPPLESRSSNIEDKDNNNSTTPNILQYHNVKSHNNHHFNNSCFNNTDHDQNIIQNSNVEDLFVGFGNHHGGQGENLRMGEWDLEGLMQDISFFPSLDFQVWKLPFFLDQIPIIPPLSLLSLYHIHTCMPLIYKVTKTSHLREFWAHIHYSWFPSSVLPKSQNINIDKPILLVIYLLSCCTHCFLNFLALQKL